MPLCKACYSFFKNAFRPPTHKLEYSRFRTETTHIRIAQVVESAVTCDVCALLKFCSIRAFETFLEDGEDNTLLRFMEMNFANEPISLVVDQTLASLPLRSKAILARFPDPPLNDTEHRKASQNINLSLWAAKDSPASRLGHVCEIPPVYQDGSENSQRLIGSWLANCLETHKGQDCTKTLSGTSIGQQVALPTRAIDVTPGQAYVRIVKTEGQQGRYVALSHCWGPREKQPIRTLQGNILQHMLRIPLTELPRTFREAVETTREIGIQYLWIDSLCIVQDDEADWKREAKTMGALYEKAELTIAATDAANSSEGLFLAGRQSKDPVEVPFHPDGQDAQGTMFVSAGARSYYSFGFSPLQERAWVFQERYFSRRILHCTSAGLLWFCKGQWRGSSHFTIDERGLIQLSDTILTRSWQEDVQEYTERRLTYEHDRLMAVEGLATEMRKRRLDEYHMGVWMNELPCSLLWLRIRQFVLHDRSDYYQPLIPSWPWASLPGRKWFVEDYDIWDSRQSSKRMLLDVRDEYAMSNPLLAKTEAADEGGLIVESYLKKAIVDKDSFELIDAVSNDGTMPDDIDGTPSIPLILFLWSGAYYIVDDKGERIGRAALDTVFSAEVYCLFLCNGQPWVHEKEKEWHRNHWFHYVLLLKKTRYPSTFRRIGLGMIMKRTWFEGKHAQRVHLT